MIKAMIVILFSGDLVRPPGWLAHSGLDLDNEGFIAVHLTLQTRCYPYIFAVGTLPA